LVSELESLLKRRVDIVEIQAIRPSFRDNILKDATPL
jgi:predicted nucleotidyltransferase